MTAVACRFHCRGCGHHFYSLQAFDAHRERLTPDGPGIGCFVPDVDEEIVGDFIGFAGECDIGGRAVKKRVAVWELASRRGTVRTRKEREAA